MRFTNKLSWYGVGFEYEAGRWHLSGDLRCWMIGFEWYPFEVDVAVGPLRLEVYR